MTHPATRAKHRGAEYESDLLAYAQTFDPHAVRPRLQGKIDRGDVVFNVNGQRVMLEAKRPGKGQPMNLTGWWNETETERRNANANAGLLVIRRHGHPNVGDSWCVVPLDVMMELLLDWKNA